MTARTRRFLVLSVLLAGLTTLARADLVVLQYHHISDATPASTSTSPSLFEGQLEMIDDLDIEVVPLQKGTRAALAGTTGKTPEVAITFDDAYENVFTEAAPKLAARQYPYTIFVNTAAVGRKGYMSWQQLQTLGQREGVTIANHSQDHGHLARRPDESLESWRDRAQSSLDKAQHALEEKLGVNPPLFAYPYGEFDENLEAMVENRGWYGYGQQSGAIGATSGKTRLPRFPMANAYGQLDTLETRLTSLALPVDATRLPDGIVADNPPLLTFDLPKDMDPQRLTCFASGQGRIDARAVDGATVEVQAGEPFASRRFRYNCTYPAGNNRFYWLSQQWLDLSRPED